MLDDLVDCSFILVNGLVGTNDFTHLSHRAKSVVDYLLVPHEEIACITMSKVHTMTVIQERVGQEHISKVPDHAIWSELLIVFVTTTRIPRGMLMRQSKKI